MLWFSKSEQLKARVKTRLGTFAFENSGWITDPCESTLAFQWINNPLDTSALERAETLMLEIGVLGKEAIKYAKTHGGDVWDCKSTLTLEAIDITDILADRIGLTFVVEGQPDFTVAVEFVNGEPASVWGAD